MPASLFNGDAVKILKNKLRFKDNTEITSTEAGHLAGVTSDIQTQLDAKIPNSEKGAVNGVATLDGGGKIPTAQLPNSVMEFKGTFDPATATFTDAGGNAGDVYLANAAGSYDAGSGSITYAIGDWAVHNGTVFEKSLNTNAVVSVAGKTGIVTLDTDDVTEATNLYFTDTRARTAAVLNTTAGNETDQAPSVLAMKNYVTASAGANTALSNLTTTSISQTLNMTGTATLRLPNNVFLTGRDGGDTVDLDVLRVNLANNLEFSLPLRPDTHAALDIGIGSTRFRRGYFSAAVRVGNSNTEGGELVDGFSTPDNTTDCFGLQTFETGKILAIATQDETAASTNSSNLLIQSGNADGTTSDSGDVYIRIGAATQNRGSLRYVDGSEGTAGHVLTSIDTVGRAQWSQLPSTFDTNSISGATNAAANQTYLTDSSGGAFAITLPAPATDAYVVVKDSTGDSEAFPVTVNPNAAETIDGASSYVIESNFESVTFVSDGTNWFKV